ncbi:MAG: hypothetical protein L6R40_004843 [Gallowayella cf. fulva]|nr:MAG: hypothetical protein L6R40_004843 [Xanthomendoza cf. fulva]
MDCFFTLCSSIVSWCTFHPNGVPAPSKLFKELFGPADEPTKQTPSPQPATNTQIFYHDNRPGDSRLPHHSGKDCSPAQLRALGVLFHNFPPSTPSSPALVEDLAKTRDYANRDEITISPAAMGAAVYEDKIQTFYTEHLHEDEEIRYILAGTGFFDVRDTEDEWIRIRVDEGDLLILPEGIYHRFTLDEGNYIKAMPLFKTLPKWTALYRSEETDKNEVRRAYLEARARGFRSEESKV